MEINDVIATGIRETYQDNPSVVFILIGTPNADKRLGVNIHISNIFCERINTICKSTASFIQIDNVYCNENYPLKDVFHFQKSNGTTQNECIVLNNINCDNYSSLGIYSNTGVVNEEIGDITFNGKGNLPVVVINNSTELNYKTGSGLNVPIVNNTVRKTISKNNSAYLIFNNDIENPTDKLDFQIGDLKLKSEFGTNAENFKNIIGYAYTYKSSASNQWIPIQAGIPLFNKYALRDTIKGTFAGQLAFNETAKTLSIWDGSKWLNVNTTEIT